MAKKSKSKPHKPPTEKFVVVVDPWRYRNFFEDIGAWFEIMLTDDYPGTRVDMIYGQVGKHHNVIVQLPGHVDIRPLLGAHRHAAILKPPYNMNTDGVSYIFEYNFEREGNPRDWAAMSPSYETIDPSFPIRFPYPIPCSVTQTYRNSKPGYAKQLPPDLWEENAVATTQLIHQTDDIISSSIASPSSLSISSTIKSPPDPIEPSLHQDGTSLRSTSQFTPYAPPSNHPSHTAYPKATRADPVEGLVPKKESDITHDLSTKKLDPYEQDDEAERLLHTDHLPSSGVPTKQENVDPAEILLRSIIPVKEEVISPGENYKPSSELLATFATLPRHLLSASSSASTAPRNPAGDYTPSHELLATFATLPAHLLSQGGMSQDPKPLKQEETTYPQIKAEPPDRSQLVVDASSRPRSVTLGAEMKNMKQPDSMIRGKQEPQDDTFSSTSTSAARTRDSRKRPQAPDSDLSGPAKQTKINRDR